VKLLLFLSIVLVIEASPSLCDEKQTPSTPQRHVETPSPDALTEAIADAEAKGDGDNDHRYVTEDGLVETPKILAAREEYLVDVWRNRRDVYAWQSTSTKMIFVLVIVVVFSGLYLSWMQFHFAHTASFRTTAANTESRTSVTDPHKPTEGTRTDLELSSRGLRISSSVIGLVILALSIAFFFLYLNYVYPIVEK
jgi:hypothetical protein